MRFFDCFVCLVEGLDLFVEVLHSPEVGGVGDGEGEEG